MRLMLDPQPERPFVMHRDRIKEYDAETWLMDDLDYAYLLDMVDILNARLWAAPLEPDQPEYYLSLVLPTGHGDIVHAPTPADAVHEMVHILDHILIEAYGENPGLTKPPPPSHAIRDGRRRRGEPPPR